MKFGQLVLLSTALGLATAHPQPHNDHASPDDAALVSRDVLAIRNAEPDADSAMTLERRKGGGGGGGGGGRGGGSSSGGSSSSGSSSGGSSGGRTSSGSTSSSPRYGGSSGGVYAGGASAPYAAGQRTPSGVSPFLFAGAGLGIGFVGAGALAAGVYLYNYDRPITYVNQSAGNQSQTHPVQCYCQRYNPCSCDGNPSQSYVDSLVGNGSYATMMANNVTLAQNGTLYIDGTLDNGTTSGAGAAFGRSSSATGGIAIGAALAAGFWML